MFRSTSTRIFAALLIAAGLTGLSAPAGADDRDLLRDSSGRPYVFILFDTSGSMHWTPTCTEAQIVGDPPGCNPNVEGDCVTPPNQCSFRCDSGDCFAPLNGDDPASKFYQAKEALYEVLKSVDGIDFGFASFNQDGLRLRSKHWLYQARNGGVNIPDFGAWPAAGSREVFGYRWACDTGNGINEVGCYSTVPADIDRSDQLWDLERVRRLPKGDIGFDQIRRIFVRADGVTYRVTYDPDDGELGDASITVDVQVERCNNSSCSNPRTDLGTIEVTFDRVAQFNSWDNGADDSGREYGYFTQGEASDSTASGTCDGWDPNDDPLADPGGGYNLKWPTVVHPVPAMRPAGNRGDVLPLSWEADNKDAILERLAPNIAIGETTPDFSTARYFRNTPNASGILELADSRARPLVANGSTPLGAMIQDFRTWYAGCSQGSCPNATGWRDLAATGDPDWGCRRKYVIVLTDGDETCNGGNSACNGTASLRAQESIKTYVVAFGVQGGGNVLTCMAANGGTGDPIFPQNKQQLVDALLDIFGEINEEARSFASAAVPSVQAQVADKIYLTSFTPLNNASVWDGHVDAYLKPLPLTEDNLPNKARRCSGSITSSCLAWDAGEELLAQAPTADDVANDLFKLGNATTERRVFYPLSPVNSNVPRSKRFFEPAPNDPLWLDLFGGLGVSYTVGDLDPAKDTVKDVMRFTLRKKEDSIEVDGIPTAITFVLGDIFHSNPEVVSTPSRFRYFAADLQGNGRDCTATTNPNRGYRCFFRKHQYRRKIVMVGANDSQLHAFDSGIFEGEVRRDPLLGTRVEGEFDNGTGKELFSIIPRSLLPTVRKLAESRNQEWGVDGTVLIDDFFLDPNHDGAPVPEEREWRTVALTGMREGGRAYMAVDVTQPDAYDSSALAEGFFIPDTGGDFVPSCTKDYDAAECGPVPYPSVLWEFTDGEVPDEDVNGEPDLGETWSVPNSGRIRVIEGEAIVDKYVAVFGGGMDPDKVNGAGDWIYMVDVETGKVLYKRELVGSAPSEPAAVDTDQNGYLDTIYIGTTAGFLYKADISTPAVLDDVTILGQTVRRVVDADWDPFAIFDTGGRPLYFPPAVIYVPYLGRYALGFGTGDREDLWSDTNQAGRFYLILDEGFGQDTVGLPLTEAVYTPVSADGSETTGTSVLFNPPTGRRPGWFITLGTEERVITKAFSLSGITFFTSYIPEIQITEPDGPGGGGPPNPGPGNDDDVPLCAKTGQSRIFVVYTDSANSVLRPEDEPSRYWLVSEFTTDPFTEQSATKNETPDDTQHADALTDELRDVMETLKGFYPDDCRFGNFTLNIKTIRSDTGVVFIAPVPICIVEKNWKEF